MKKLWWKESVVYEIYIKSFKDSNNDGIGDFKGIIEKLGYLKELGVDILWFTPIYKSPNDDNGYDIADYKSTMKEYGTMEDFEELLSKAHDMGLKVILDIALNHTSDEHPWFLESKASKTSDKREYYIWKEPKNGSEPNNWGSYFSPSAWEYDDKTGEYYLHIFSKKQPDLNWKNEKLREDVYEILKWWLDKGIDGFRLDVINAIAKKEGFPDNVEGIKNGKYVTDFRQYYNQNGIHELLKEMNKQVFSKYDVVTVGETGCITTEHAKEYTKDGSNELDMVFQFNVVDLGGGPNGKWDNIPWKLTELKKIISDWQIELYNNGWQGIFFCNHDQPRAVSRFGNDSTYWQESAKMLATLLFTLQGTPFIYQGEEIGMTNVKFESIDDYNDIEIKFFYDQVVNNKGWTHEQAMKSIYAVGRDNARTPIQWSDELNAGFTSGEPWLKLNPNYKSINVKSQEGDEDSVLSFYKKVIKLRKENPCLVYGSYKLLNDKDETIFSYIREDEDSKMIILLSFSESEVKFNAPEDISLDKSELLLSNYNNSESNSCVLKPYEARVYKLINT